MNVSRPKDESLEKKILNNYMAIQRHQQEGGERFEELKKRGEELKQAYLKKNPNPL